MPGTGTAKAGRSRHARPSPHRLSEDDPWLLKRLVESINSGLIVLDGAERVVAFNAAAEAITGVGRAAVIGRPFADCLGPDNQRILAGEMALSTSPRENREVTLRHASGTPLPIGYTSSPLVDELGGVLGTVIIFKDLTEIFALREEMGRREHLASIGEMTASIAHEIRNPLAAMQTAAETLKSELGYDQEKEQYVDLITREIKRLANLINDFFAYVKPVEPRHEVVDVHEVLDVLLFIEAGKIRKNGLALNARYGGEVPPLRTDRNLLQQALLNLLLNAIQASGEGGAVTIETAFEPAPPTLRVAVRDTGEGIPADIRGRIFQPFFTTRTKGIGLGLAITERIVKALGGRIEVASEPGAGSTFTLIVPAEPA